MQQLYSLQRGKTLKYIWWWGSSSGELESVAYLFKLYPDITIFPPDMGK